MTRTAKIRSNARVLAYDAGALCLVAAVIGILARVGEILAGVGHGLLASHFLTLGLAGTLLQLVGAPAGDRRRGAVIEVPR
jgi:hypothetical protein